MAECYFFSVLLYRNYDKDILALKECNVVFASLIKLALYYYVRGKKLNIFVDGCFKYDFKAESGKSYVKDVVKITDPESIRFLKSQVNYREKLAFVRCAIRAAMIRPAYGAYYKSERMIALENELIKEIDLSGYNDLVICSPLSDVNGRKIQRPEIIRKSDLSSWIPEELFSISECDKDEFVSGDRNCHVNNLPFSESPERGGRHRNRKKKKKQRGLVSDASNHASAGLLSESTDKPADDDKQHGNQVADAPPKKDTGVPDSSLSSSLVQDEEDNYGPYAGFLNF